MRALAAFENMVVQETTGRGGLAHRDPVDDSAVLGHRDRQGARAVQRCAPVEVQLVDQAPVEVRELGVARELDDTVVELEIECEVLVGFTAPAADPMRSTSC